MFGLSFLTPNVLKVFTAQRRRKKLELNKPPAGAYTSLELIGILGGL